MNNDNLNSSVSPAPKPKRNLLAILTSMISIIPNEGEDNFKSDLEYALNQAAFTPPENMYSIWMNAQNVINNRFKQHKDTTNLPEWCSLLVDIWTDRKRD